MKIDDLRKAYAVRPGYWFAPKLFGIGATPVTWQGWTTILAYVAVVLALGASFEGPDMIVAVIALTLPFLVLVWMKTDGGWRWHWGWRCKG